MYFPSTLSSRNTGQNDTAHDQTNLLCQSQGTNRLQISRKEERLFGRKVVEGLGARV